MNKTIATQALQFCLPCSVRRCSPPGDLERPALHSNRLLPIPGQCQDESGAMAACRHGQDPPRTSLQNRMTAIR